MKIGAHGISNIPMTLSQSFNSSQPFNMSFSQDGSQSQFSSPMPKSQTPLSTFDSPPPKATNRRHTKPKRFQPYEVKEKVNDFEVVKHLGDGASSRVDLVKSKNDGKMYAMKVITTESKIAKLIFNEVKALSKCHKCPYIVKLYQAYYSDKQTHILLEYMDGNSLQEVLKAVGRVPERILKLIAYQVLKGLSYLHINSRIVHRDIKPANILIKRNGQVKISDFGLTGIYSKTKHEDEKNFGSGKNYGVNNPFVFKTCQGTLLYMSPERIREQNHSYNSDIWSIGITFAELLTGRYPFKSTQYFDVLDEISHLSQLPIDPNICSEQCRSFLNSCVVVDPDKRPGSADMLEHPFVKDLQAGSVENMQAEIAQWLRANMPPSL